MQSSIVFNHKVCGGTQDIFGQLSVQAAARHFRRNAIPRTDALHAGFIRRGNQNEMAAPLLERGTHDHRTVHKEELFPRLPGFRHGKIQPMVDFRLGDGGQPSGALRCGKGTVRQQAAAHLTGFIHNIGTEFLLELHNAGRTRQQNFPRHLVGIHTAEPRGTDAVRQGGFAAAGTPGNANDLHIRPPPRGTPRHGSGGYTRPWKRHR